MSVALARLKLSRLKRHLRTKAKAVGMGCLVLLHYSFRKHLVLSSILTALKWRATALGAFKAPLVIYNSLYSLLYHEKPKIMLRNC